MSEYKSETNHKGIDNTETNPSLRDMADIADGGSSLETPALVAQHGYKYVELIGEGTFGKTYKAVRLEDGEFVAVKALKFSENLKDYDLFKRETEILKSINSPNVPQYYETISSGEAFTECWIVQEYIEGKNLLEILEEKQKTQGRAFTERGVFEMLWECSEIIQMLQTKYNPPIIHRDIKPSNIMMRKHAINGNRFVFVDFGAVANPQRRIVNSTVAGTVGYMAPEQLIGDCCVQSDYYALGATALHLLTGIAPCNFPSDGFSIQFKDKLRECLPDVSDNMVELLEKLLLQNASDRPANADELCNCIYEASIRNLNGAEYKKYLRNYKICRWINRELLDGTAAIIFAPLYIFGLLIGGSIWYFKSGLCDGSALSIIIYIIVFLFFLALLFAAGPLTESIGTKLAIKLGIREPFGYDKYKNRNKSVSSDGTELGTVVALHHVEQFNYILEYIVTDGNGVKLRVVNTTIQENENLRVGAKVRVLIKGRMNTAEIKQILL